MDHVFKSKSAFPEVEPAGDCGCNFQDSNLLAKSCGSVGDVAMFMSLLDIVIRAQCSISDPCRRAKPNNPYFNHPEIESFDFVIVGAGVAGPVLTSRLSEDEGFDILLLEAGPEEPSVTSVPAFASSAIGTFLDWKYTTTAQKNACLHTGGLCQWPRGKMVGGSCSMSGMMYTRGHKEIYDSWYRAGNVGWSYEDVLTYFRKSENNTEPWDQIDPGYHGYQGPLPVTRFPYQPEILSDFLAAGHDLGYRIGDLNGVNQTGFSAAPVMHQDGQRAGPTKMYLRPALSRPNVHVRTLSHVTKVLLEGSRAVGVEYVDELGNTRKVRVKKEVILTAGVVGSAQILLLSGIGPEQELSKLGIKTIRNLPVGRNLHHHVGIDYRVKVNAASDVLSVQALDEYLRYRTGPLSSTGLTQLTAFVESAFAEPGIPDIQLYVDGFNPDCRHYGKTLQESYIRFRPCYLLPESRGYLKLKSTNPFEYPEINPNYLSVRKDVHVLTDALRFIERFLRSESLAKWDLRYAESRSECEHLRTSFSHEDDKYRECRVRHYTLPENHHGGTCKMGPSGDRMAVVDPKLRVRGFPNLRVADASIFPSPINANPIAPIIMVAEKAAEYIKETWT